LGRGAVSILQEAGFRVPDGLGDAKWRGTRHLTRRSRDKATHRLLVLGDAAGYVEPFTGEGIAWALESGREAAALACRSIESFDSRVEASWTRRHQEIVGHSQRRCALIAAGLRRESLMKLAVTLLARAPQFAAPVIRRLNARSHGEASQ
jgi:flavin-dependent dehydrogenase